MNRHYRCLIPRVGLTIALTAGSVLMAQSPGTPSQSPSPSGQPTGARQQSPGMATQPGVGSSNMSAENAAMASGDKAFVSKALEGGLAEVQLGQLAAQKSQSDDVKQFGQKMVTDHTQMGDQMKPVAQQLGVVPPSQPSKKVRKEMQRLQGLSGQDFDREYIRMMVMDHRQDLKDFKHEAASANDPKVKDAATQDVEVISQHLQMIEQIAKAHNVDVGSSDMAGVK